MNLCLCARFYDPQVMHSAGLVIFKEFAFNMRSCHECASSLLSGDCPLQRLAFQMRSLDLVVNPCWTASLFLSFFLPDNIQSTSSHSFQLIVDQLQDNDRKTKGPCPPDLRRKLSLSAQRWGRLNSSRTFLRHQQVPHAETTPLEQSD